MKYIPKALQGKRTLGAITKSFTNMIAELDTLIDGNNAAIEARRVQQEQLATAQAADAAEIAAARKVRGQLTALVS